jgi:hypothetical protein
MAQLKQQWEQYPSHPIFIGKTLDEFKENNALRASVLNQKWFEVTKNESSITKDYKANPLYDQRAD